LKTDKNFEFNVQGGGAVDLTVDFDLSQSIVVTGPGPTNLNQRNPFSLIKRRRIPLKTD